MSINVPLERAGFEQVDMDEAETLFGFEFDGAVYHVLLFTRDGGGGALGIWKDGDDYCGMISLDGLAAFHNQAKSEYVEGQDDRNETV